MAVPMSPLLSPESTLKDALSHARSTRMSRPGSWWTQPGCFSVSSRGIDRGASARRRAEPRAGGSTAPGSSTGHVGRGPPRRRSGSGPSSTSPGGSPGGRGRLRPSLGLSILAVRVRRLLAPHLTIAGILYTIPSLALFAALVPVTGLSPPDRRDPARPVHAPDLRAQHRGRARRGPGRCHRGGRRDGLLGAGRSGASSCRSPSPSWSPESAWRASRRSGWSRSRGSSATASAASASSSSRVTGAASRPRSSRARCHRSSSRSSWIVCSWCSSDGSRLAPWAGAGRLHDEPRHGHGRLADRPCPVDRARRHPAATRRAHRPVGDLPAHCGLIALPVGLAIGHTGRGSVFAANLANIGRAIPSLAVIGIVLPITASIDPQLGLQGLPDPRRDGDPRDTADPRQRRGRGRGGGSRPRRVGRGDGDARAPGVVSVEIPVALPVILGGVRSAARRSSRR